MCLCYALTYNLQKEELGQVFGASREQESGLAGVLYTMCLLRYRAYMPFNCLHLSTWSVCCSGPLLCCAVNLKAQKTHIS